MTFEWQLLTPRTRAFKVVETIVISEESPGVGEDGEPTVLVVENKVEHLQEVDRPANRIRITAAANSTSTGQFYIRFMYGRDGAHGGFEGAVRDDGIIIGGPEYAALDTNQDGLISEDELLNMSAKILGWDGALVKLGSDEAALP